MHTVTHLIDKLGGTLAVAAALDLAPTTVSSWKSSGSVPKWRMPGLRQLAQEKGVEMPDAFAKPAQPAQDKAA